MFLQSGEKMSLTIFLLYPSLFYITTDVIVASISEDELLAQSVDNS